MVRKIERHLQTKPLAPLLESELPQLLPELSGLGRDRQAEQPEPNRHRVVHHLNLHEAGSLNSEGSHDGSSVCGRYCRRRMHLSVLFVGTALVTMAASPKPLKRSHAPAAHDVKRVHSTTTTARTTGSAQLQRRKRSTTMTARVKTSTAAPARTNSTARMRKSARPLRSTAAPARKTASAHSLYPAFGPSLGWQISHVQGHSRDPSQANLVKDLSSIPNHRCCLRMARIYRAFLVSIRLCASSRQPGFYPPYAFSYWAKRQSETRSRSSRGRLLNVSSDDWLGAWRPGDFRPHREKRPPCCNSRYYFSFDSAAFDFPQREANVLNLGVPFNRFCGADFVLAIP